MATTKDPGPEAEPRSVDRKVDDLRGRKQEALVAGGSQAIEKQHDRGKLTARERIELLLDRDSFVETDMLSRHRVSAFGLEKNRPYGDGV
ncbi:MAG: carboxyl transferase domain-containing protein, partial [Actinomycetota bacterium]